jgi:hypothetical protein
MAAKTAIAISEPFRLAIAISFSTLITFARPLGRRSSQIGAVLRIE